MGIFELTGCTVPGCMGIGISLIDYRDMFGPAVRLCRQHAIEQGYCLRCLSNRATVGGDGLCTACRSLLLSLEAQQYGWDTDESEEPYDGELPDVGDDKGENS